MTPIGPDASSEKFPSKCFLRALSLAGLRRVRFPDFRLSFASLLIEQGLDLNYVKEQLGHHSINAHRRYLRSLWFRVDQRWFKSRLDDNAVSGPTGWTIGRQKKRFGKHSMETIGKKIRFDGRKLLKVLARPEGFEPPTLRSEV